MRYRFEPVIFASAPLDNRDWRWHLTSAFSQRFRKYTFTAVHTKTHRRRFQIDPLWRAFSNLCVYGERFHRLRVDGRPKRIKKFAFTIVFVWTGPKNSSEHISFCKVHILSIIWKSTCCSRKASSSLCCAPAFLSCSSLFSSSNNLNKSNTNLFVEKGFTQSTSVAARCLL